MKISTYISQGKPVITDTVAAYYELTKPGITIMVVASMLVGFILASNGTIDYLNLLNAVIGTMLIAAGTAAHNQYIERDLDKLMIRTSKRPLPMDRLNSSHALIFSAGLIALGLFYLLFTVNYVAASVSLATSLIYLFLYTPFKRLTAWNIPVGSIAGALPPVGGWAAVTGDLSHIGMWLLFSIIFFWQMPHVLSIVWLCKHDYETAGFRMLPKNDTTGRLTAFLSMVCLIALIPVTILLYTLGYNSIFFLFGGLTVALLFIASGIRFLYNREKKSAKQLMFGSLIYLPLVWILILIDYIFF